MEATEKVPARSTAFLRVDEFRIAACALARVRNGPSVYDEFGEDKSPDQESLPFGLET